MASGSSEELNLEDCILADFFLLYNVVGFFKRQKEAKKHPKVSKSYLPPKVESKLLRREISSIVFIQSLGNFEMGVTESGSM